MIAGEGGLISINRSEFTNRAEIIWEKGTNRAAFFRGEIDKYNWVDIGSSFLPSEINAAFLYAQLHNLKVIQSKRKKIWDQYYEALKPMADKEFFKIVEIPGFATNNYHMFYLICNHAKDQMALIDHLKSKDIMAVFHYQPLHSSPFYHKQHGKALLPNCDYFASRVVRLPFYCNLKEDTIDYITETIKVYFSK